MHVEAKANSPSIYIAQYKCKERIEKFYSFFIRNDEYEEDKTNMIPRYQFPFEDDDELVTEEDSISEQ